MPGAREYRKSHTRSVLIEAGIRLMHAQGYAQTTTTAIAQAAGVSPATLFNYFPTKAALVLGDAHLWAPVEGVEAGGSLTETMRRIVWNVVTEAEWTRPLEDPLTAMRFELIRTEPELVTAQLADAFAQVPTCADLLMEAHPEATRDEAIEVAGATIGSLMAILTWGGSGDLQALVAQVLDSDAS